MILEVQQSGYRVEICTPLGTGRGAVSNDPAELRFYGIIVSVPCKAKVVERVSEQRNPSGPHRDNISS